MLVTEGSVRGLGTVTEYTLVSISSASQVVSYPDTSRYFSSTLGHVPNLSR